MSVARHLGVEDADTPLMREAQLQWHVWTAAEPALAVVRELFDLRAWGESAPYDERDRVHGALAKLGAVDGSDQDVAASALTWVLLPGTQRILRAVAPFTDDGDALIASNLWIAVKTANWEHPHRLAAAILGETRGNVLAEIGIGQRARKRDRTWSNTVTTDTYCRESATLPEHELSATEELRRIVTLARVERVLAPDELDLLLEAAQVADELAAPVGRGRSGLTTPAVASRLAETRGISTRTIARRIVRITERIRDLVASDDIKDALSTEPLIGPGSGEEAEKYGLAVITSLGGVA